MKRKIQQRFLNLIYYMVVLGCLIYGIGSITYATDNTSQPDATITIDQNGQSSSIGDLFNGSLWYPGYQKEGILRIVNNYKKASINDLGLDVKVGENSVYDSFIDNMRLTIEKGNLFDFTEVIAKNKTLREILKEGISFSPGAINIRNSMDFKYILKMVETAPNELENISALITFTFNAGEIIEHNSGGGDSNNGEFANNEETAPPKFDGDLIDRMPGYITLNEAKEINEIIEKIIIPFNAELLRENKDHTPRIYYWNELVEDWIALASYVIDPYQVMAINDGGYTGWFNVFGVIQPNFIDVLDHWAEPIANRMNGLGILEGYPGDGLIRTAQLDQDITRTEFTALIYRLLNIIPDRHLLETYTLEEARIVLSEYYGDAGDIPDWVAGVVASATKAGLVEPREGKFLANEPITREEAAVMVSKAFKMLEKYQPIDLTKFADAEDISDWAKAALADNAIQGYPDNTFRPNDFITRAEALTVLKRLFINGMGL